MSTSACPFPGKTRRALLRASLDLFAVVTVTFVLGERALSNAACLVHNVCVSHTTSIGSITVMRTGAHYNITHRTVVCRTHTATIRLQNTRYTHTCYYIVHVCVYVYTYTCVMCTAVSAHDRFTFLLYAHIFPLVFGLLRARPCVLRRRGYARTAPATTAQPADTHFDGAPREKFDDKRVLRCCVSL